MVPEFPYSPALDSKIKENPVSIAASEINCKRGNSHGVNMAVYVKYGIFSQKIVT
jgi:hypothetical protein